VIVCQKHSLVEIKVLPHLVVTLLHTSKLLKLQKHESACGATAEALLGEKWGKATDL
jgi:hypothetical protein